MRAWWIVSAAAVLLGACAPEASSPTAGASGTPLLGIPHPRTVAVRLDAAHAATAAIPETGGSITTTNADGTVFTLAIPDKALAGDEHVTMTPVQAIAGSPLSVGPQESVHLEPDGLDGTARLFELTL